MNIFLNAALLWLLYIVLTTIYNVAFHPLAKYPGPLTWRLFQFPSLICMINGDLPFRVKRLHDQYGPVIRVAPNELSFQDPRAYKDIFVRRDFLRPPQWGTKPPMVKSHNLISAPQDIHTRYRKALAPAFSEKAVRSYEPLIRSYFDKLIGCLDATIGNSESGKVDLVQWINFTTFDIIGALCWGRSFDCLEKSREHAFMTILLHFKAVLVLSSIKYYPWIDAVMPYITPKSAISMLQNIFATGHERIQARLKSTDKQADLISYMQPDHAVPSESRMTPDEIEQNALTLIVAGSETLTTAFSAAFHHLIANPGKFATLKEEIHSHFHSLMDISGASTTQLPYLNAVINESLRLGPPLPDSLRRQVPRGGAQVAGEYLPAGVAVSVSSWTMFRTASHFDAPHQFRPERWLNRSDSAKNKHVEEAFYPFSLGPRGCPGKSIALLELRVLLAMLVWRYEFVPVGEVPKWTDQKVFFTWEKQPLNLKLRIVR